MFENQLHKAKEELTKVSEANAYTTNLLGHKGSEISRLRRVSAREPTVEERRQHELTHLPYEAWCTACLKHRARQDQRRRTGKAHEQGCPTISFDFCYVKASGSGAIGEEEDDGARTGLEVERGALLLVAVCSQTGYLLALPVKSKNESHHPRRADLAPDPQAFGDSKVIDGPEDDYEDNQDL